MMYAVEMISTEAQTMGDSTALTFSFVRARAFFISGVEPITAIMSVTA